MGVFTVCIIFFRVLRKCYKITVPHSIFYLEFSYSFWQIFFSVYEAVYLSVENYREIDLDIETYGTINQDAWNYADILPGH